MTPMDEKADSGSLWMWDDKEYIFVTFKSASSAPKATNT